MNQLLLMLRRKPKLSGLLAMFVAAIAVPAALLAWGPDRPTFTIDNPAPYITFNSMTDNPVVGDERLFTSVKDASNQQAGGWKDTMAVEPGKEYLVRIYVHNNAAANLNLVAENTRVAAAIGTNTGKKVSLTGYVSADNAKPKRVHDDVHFTSSGADFNLAYVPGSAMLYNNVTGQNGRSVSDSIVNGSGAQIGYQSNNGKMPGCFEYVAYVTFKVKPQFAKKVTFDTEKKVSKHKANSWSDSYKAQPGETVDFRIKYSNTGTTEQRNVVVKDNLPAGLTYVKGSTRLFNSQTPASGKVLSDNLTGNGVNIGHYAPKAWAYVAFSATVAKNDDLAKCNLNTLRNVASVKVGDKSKSDDATVTVNKKCVTPPQPKTPDVSIDKQVRAEAGDGMTKEEALEQARNFKPKGPCTTVMTPAVHLETGARYTFNSGCLPDGWVAERNYTGPSQSSDWVDHVKLNIDQTFEYRLVVKNTGEVTLKNARVTDSAPTGVKFISADKGEIVAGNWSYTIPELAVGNSLTVVIKAQVTEYVKGKIVNTACVDATEIPGNQDDCDDATVEVEKPTPPAPEPEPEMVWVCDTKTGEVIKISEDKADDERYAPVDSKECQDEEVPTPEPEMVKVCDTKTGEIVKVTEEESQNDRYAPVNSEKCQDEEAEVPAELPQTGMSGLVTLLGLGSMTSAAAYYLHSRRL